MKSSLRTIFAKDRLSKFWSWFLEMWFVSFVVFVLSVAGFSYLTHSPALYDLAVDSLLLVAIVTFKSAATRI